MPAPSSAATRRIVPPRSPPRRRSAAPPRRSARACAQACARPARAAPRSARLSGGLDISYTVPLAVRTMHDNTYEIRQTATTPGIVAEGLGKRYGDLWALRDLDLDVPAGTVLGLLGHNGAGKTTAVRILTTLALPTTGSARVAGLDVVADAAGVRARIGLAAQAATVDGLLTRPQEPRARRPALPPAARRRPRSARTSCSSGSSLADDADRLVKTFSGGMRRRLDLAATLVATPPVLFLDEPTTGLDPQSRNDLWALLRELVARRHDAAAHHPVPRGGRPPGRRHRGARPRARRRVRLARRAEGADRRRADRRRPSRPPSDLAAGEAALRAVRRRPAVAATPTPRRHRAGAPPARRCSRSCARSTPPASPPPTSTAARRRWTTSS